MSAEPKYRHRAECRIVRDSEDYPESALLIDDDGEIVRSFGSHWNDDAIWTALAFANRAYAAGFAYGTWSKADEIRRALNIEEVTHG